MITSSFFGVVKYAKFLYSQQLRFNSFRAVGSGVRKQLTLNSKPGQLVRLTLASMVFACLMFHYPGETLIHVFVVMLATISVTFYSFLYQQFRQVSFFSAEKSDKNILGAHC